MIRTFSIRVRRLPNYHDKIYSHQCLNDGTKAGHLEAVYRSCLVRMRSSTSTTDLDKKKKRESTKFDNDKIASGRQNIDIDKPIDNVVSSTSSSMVRSLSPKIQPYAELARLDKPIGTMLLLWPCCWSTAIAANASNISSEVGERVMDISSVIGDPQLLFLFATGSFLMRGAGCTINDMWDAQYDKKVKRTAGRPLASGVLTYKQATGFLGMQLTGGLAVLTSLPHLDYCFWLGASSLPLVATYPLMKRFTNWPQLILGMTFNWGAFMGWAATHGTLDAFNGLSVVLPLYTGGVCWTLVYDTLYAHQDKDDDATLGLKSTALHFGANTKPILFAFSTLATGFWMLAGYNVGFVEPYFYIGCSAAGSHLFWQVASANLNDSKNLAERFKSNNTVGAILFGSCIAGNISTLMN